MMVKLQYQHHRLQSKPQLKSTNPKITALSMSNVSNPLGSAQVARGRNQQLSRLLKIQQRRQMLPKRLPLWLTHLDQKMMCRHLQESRQLKALSLFKSQLMPQLKSYQQKQLNRVLRREVGEKRLYENQRQWLPQQVLEQRGSGKVHLLKPTVLRAERRLLVVKRRSVIVVLANNSNN
jgi:hypothetical protein